MLIRPEIAALRHDDTPQRRAQAAMGEVLAQWCASPLVAGAEAELARWSIGAVLDDLPVLSTLFAEGGDDAARFCTGAVARFLAVLFDCPIAQSPLRHYLDDRVASITLLRHGTTLLSLQAIDGHAFGQAPPASTVRFVPCETVELVLAGTATAERIVLGGTHDKHAELIRESCELLPGLVNHRRGREAALRLIHITGTLVTLRLQRRVGCAEVTREYALADGELLHQTAGSPRDSRLELTAALLGRMGRRDAAPLLAAMAEERSAPSLRWQVLRECLALDTAQGFAALCRIACNDSDPLSAHAGALRAQLIEAHPQLAGLDPCPA